MRRHLQVFHKNKIFMAETLERIIVYSLLNDPEYFQKAGPFIKQDYFVDKETKEVFGIFRNYVEKYDDVPSRTELRTILNEREIEDDLKDLCHEVLDFQTDDEINLEWIMEESEDYCRKRATYLAILESLDIIEGNQKKLKASVVPELLERAINLKFDNDIGIDFWEELERKVEKYDESVTKIPFKLGMLNKVTEGGYERRAVVGVAAPTGFGKSIWLGDEALHASEMGYNVAYITFEMSDSRIEARLDANALDETMSVMKTMEVETLKKRFENLRNKKHGYLVIKEYGPGEVTAQNLSTYLKEVKMAKGEPVDVLVVDYLNLMASFRYAASNGTYLTLKGVCEELVALAKRHNIAILTATQFNRGGQKNSSPEIKDISESQGIANTLDALFAMYDNEELEKMNKAVFKQLKNRFGDKNYFKSFLVGINRSKMKFHDVAEEESHALADNVQTPEIVDVDNAKPVFDNTPLGDEFAKFKDKRGKFANFSFE
ncbi:DnaB-like replicative helicase [Rhizobium phage RL38J1]|uniref:DnaB-like replicative helicase n=1 Tax=Rhizobium phage RL38J1 TaxID=2663232 RepID=A0A6B9J6F5_9CAUD|nr:DnaB-like replicative helicase [Rhizobium phage RL38J1]QGZ13851.1 ATP-dependent helicase [Rhizobium phage RL38J1]